MKGLKFLYKTPLILTMSAVLMGCNTAKQEQSNKDTATQEKSTKKIRNGHMKGLLVQNTGEN